METKFSISIILILVLTFSHHLMQAQKTKVLNGISGLKTRNMGPIIEGNSIKGYYLFCQEDRLDFKTSSYQLWILDENGNEVGSERIKGSKYLNLVEGAYNGKTILMKFYNAKDKQVIIKRFGKDGKLIKTFSSKLEKYEASVYQSNGDKEIEGTSLHAIPGKGFANYRFVKNKKIGYKIEFYPENGEKWKTGSARESKNVEMANFLGVQGDVLLSSVTKKNSILSRKVRNTILGTDINTGKKRFEVKMNNADYDIQIMSVVPDSQDGDIQLLGLYFKLGDNVFKDPSLGFCKIQIDQNGIISDSKFISWASDVSKFIPVNEKGKLNGTGYVYFHKIVTDARGEVFLIGEQYKKTVSPLGIAINVIGGRASNFQLTVSDLITFHLSRDFDLKGVDIFSKSKSQIELPAGAGINGVHLLAAYMKIYGAFDYSFTQEALDKSVFTVGFVDWEKKRKEKNSLIFGAITRVDGKYVLDKIDMETKASYISVQPGKPGYVLLFEYFRKDKRLEIHQEQINY